MVKVHFCYEVFLFFLLHQTDCGHGLVGLSYVKLRFISLRTQCQHARRQKRSKYGENIFYHCKVKKQKTKNEHKKAFIGKYLTKGGSQWL